MVNPCPNINFYGPKRTRSLASATSSASILLHHSHITRGSHHGDTESHHGFDPAAATSATVADREHPIKANILEPSRMNMSASVLGL